MPQRRRAIDAIAFKEDEAAYTAHIAHIAHMAHIAQIAHIAHCSSERIAGHTLVRFPNPLALVSRRT